MILRASPNLEQQKRLKKAGLILFCIFPDGYGELINQNTYRKLWGKYRDANGISSDRVPYELLHTFVSMNKSVPQPLLQQVVGHGRDMDTFGVYGHALGGEADKTADLIDESFDKILG